jgi:peptidoglycan hydrolase-like protein with peptidoglycan-binding domain
MIKSSRRGRETARFQNARLHLCLFGALALGAACDPGGATVPGQQRDLEPGMEGPEVSAVQNYLRTYGYFPNPTLAKEDPAWRPVVAELPRHWGTFDATTEAAVRAFQERSGLAITGVVDGPTSSLMRQPRCGRPERAPGPDARDKFALVGTKWGKTSIKWQLQTSPAVPGVTQANAKVAIRAGFATWAREGDRQFGEAASGDTVDILIKVANDLGSCSDPMGGTTTATGAFPTPGNTQLTVKLNQNCQFWVQSSGTDTLPAASMDLISVLTHEFGHTVGLDHSTFSVMGGSTAQMFPTLSNGVIRRGLIEDDRLAYGTLYNPWNHIQGCSSDIAGGADGSIWIIDCDLQPGAGGGRIWKNSNTTDWIVDAANGRAMFIAVAPNGIPWVVNSFGDVFRRTSTSPAQGGWEFLGGCATDIGIGSDGSVWKIGCDNVPGGHSIFKWNGSSFVKTNDSGAALNIAVDSQGRPWVTNSAGDVFQRDTSSTSTGRWILLPRVTSAGARDIAIMQAGPDDTNYAWVVTADNDVGSRNVFIFDQQIAETSGGKTLAPPKWNWFNDQNFLNSDPAVRIGVTFKAGKSVPWVRDRLGDIFNKSR